MNTWLGKKRHDLFSRVYSKIMVLAGGQLGVYCDSQVTYFKSLIDLFCGWDHKFYSFKQIIYSALDHRCKSEVKPVDLNWLDQSWNLQVSEEIYRDLPSALQQKVSVQE